MDCTWELLVDSQIHGVYKSALCCGLNTAIGCFWTDWRFVMTNVLCTRTQNTFITGHCVSPYCTHQLVPYINNELLSVGQIITVPTDAATNLSRNSWKWSQGHCSRNSQHLFAKVLCSFSTILVLTQWGWPGTSSSSFVGELHSTFHIPWTHLPTNNHLFLSLYNHVRNWQSSTFLTSKD